MWIKRGLVALLTVAVVGTVLFFSHTETLSKLTYSERQISEPTMQDDLSIDAYLYTFVYNGNDDIPIDAGIYDRNDDLPIDAKIYDRKDDLLIDASERVTIINPYANVDWDEFRAFKASLHTHSRASAINQPGDIFITHPAGNSPNTTSAMVERAFEVGFDIVAMTDHSYTTHLWSTASTPDGIYNEALCPEREAAIMRGEGRDGRPMFQIPFSNEQSHSSHRDIETPYGVFNRTNLHINTFFAPFNNVPWSGASLRGTLSIVQAEGGLSIINHPGRNTGASGGEGISLVAGAVAARNPIVVAAHADLFLEFDSLVGMEIVSGLDEKHSDRIHWDNVLMRTMPAGRPVWGFANDDAHDVNMMGYSFNMLMMDPSQVNIDSTMLAGAQSESNPIFQALKNGAFFSVSRVSRRDGINTELYPPAVLNDWPHEPWNSPNPTNVMPWLGHQATLYLLEQPVPLITRIKVNDTAGTITITARCATICGIICTDENCSIVIDWIAADGRVIETGATLNVLEKADAIEYGYVRAEIRSSTGIAFTQPFGVRFLD